jgi:hypothetical protein
MGDNEDLPFREEGESREAPPAPRAGEPSYPPPPPEGASTRPRPPEPADDRDPERARRRFERAFERAIPEVLKRVVERAVESGASRVAEGASRVAEAPENLRHFVQDLKLPKEVLHYLYTQIDDTKNGLYRVVAKEIRDVLEQTQFADEITKVLTKLSFEIKTEIRFIPNDAAAGKRTEGGEETEGGRKLPKPEVVSQVSVKDRGKDPRREKRSREDT